MGLDTTHDCWHGAYSAFMRWRAQIAETAGFPPLMSFSTYGGDRSWEPYADDPLVKLLDHSDCDGEIQSKDCAPLAERLEGLLERLPEGRDGGHISDWREKTKKFIAGLRQASAAGEDVEFF